MTIVCRLNFSAVNLIFLSLLLASKVLLLIDFPCLTYFTSSEAIHLNIANIIFTSPFV